MKMGNHIPTFQTLRQDEGMGPLSQVTNSASTPTHWFWKVLLGTLFICVVVIIIAMAVTLANMTTQIKSLDRKLDNALENMQAVDNNLQLELERLNANLTSTISARDHNIGVTYVRWGARGCPDNINTFRLYEGAAASTKGADTGGGSNHVCLPSEGPEWAAYTDARENDRAHIYGAEYRNADEASLWGDVPCAVCLATTRGTILMIPGKLTCPVAWTTEYSGYLMAQRYDYSTPSEYICVDRQQQVTPEGSARQDATGFYKTEITCGTLLCPPYVAGRELTCVVCTK